MRQRMYKSNVKRPNTCDCIIKRIIRGLLDIDSYLYEATYDLILTCRNLPIGIQLRKFVMNHVSHNIS